MASAVEAVLRHCRERPREECVGVVLSTGEVVPLTNISPSPARRFEVHPREWIAVERAALAQGRHIAALYHSHPDGSGALSDIDLKFLTPGGAPLVPEAWLVLPAVARVLRFAFHGGRWRAISSGGSSTSVPRAADWK